MRAFGALTLAVVGVMYYYKVVEPQVLFWSAVMVWAVHVATSLRMLAEDARLKQRTRGYCDTMLNPETPVYQQPSQPYPPPEPPRVAKGEIQRGE